MAEAKWTGVLSTTEPRNDIGILNVRQGNSNSETVEFQIIQNNKPYDLTGTKVYFCTNFGLSAVEKAAVVKDAAKGVVTFIFNDQSMQEVGRQMAYFQITKDEVMIDSTQDFEFRIESSILSRLMEGGSYIERFEKILETLGDNAAYELAKELDKTNDLLNRTMTQTEFDSWVATLLDGGPSIFMDSLAALNAAYPNGSSGVALVRETDPAKIYVWIGSNWQYYGNYQGVEIKDGTVTPKKTTFFTSFGKNLFNKDDITRGKFASYSSGNIGDLITYGVSDFIEVLPNTYYTKNVTQQFPFYDANKVYISGLDGVNTFLTPSNAKYVRINFELTNLSNVQLELGKATTIYEPFQSTLSNSKIQDAEKIVKMTHGKNLFNPSEKYAGRYISYDIGDVGVNADFFATGYIELIEGATYTKNDPQQFALYDKNKQFVTGMENAKTFTVPIGVKYGRFSINNAYGYSVDTFQLEEGTMSTSYEPYTLVIPDELLPSSQYTGYKNYVTVGKTNADFTSIKDALDSTTSDIAIKLLQGIYLESLNIFATTRKVSIIGVDRDNCIIQNNSGDYYKAPLNCSGNIYVENVSFIATHTDVTTYAIPAYAVHADSNGAGTMHFKNCKMVSYQNSAVGIGLHQDQTFILDNCELIKISDRDGGSLYAHNAQASNVTNQKLIVKNCIIKTDFGFVIKIDDANTYNDGINSQMAITFYFNVVHSETMPKDQRVWYRDASINGGVSGQITLTDDSFGNNENKMNA